MFESYFTRIAEILQQVRDTQAEPIHLAAGKIADTIARKGTIYAFGCNHANLLAKELVFRTGGLAVINLIESPGLDLDVRPISLIQKVFRRDTRPVCIFLTLQTSFWTIAATSGTLSSSFKV